MKHREKQLLAAAFRYGLQMNPGDIAGSQTVSHDFLQGARWADANPPQAWTCVSEGLPHVAPGETSLSERVLVLRASSYVDFDRYDYSEQSWLFKDRTRPTHWMPLPPPSQPMAYPPTPSAAPPAASTPSAAPALLLGAHKRAPTPTPANLRAQCQASNAQAKPQTDMPTRTSYLLSLLRRDSKGRLLLPRCVASHINEIDRLMPGSITDSDRRQLEHIANLPDKPIR